MNSKILLEKTGQVAVITFNRPKSLNAFNEQMHQELYDTLNLLGEDPDVRCIVLQGSGKGFSAGADLNMEEQVDYGDYLRKTYNRLLLCLTNLKKPVIASLHGPVYGAGIGIALACDFRIASSSSTYCMAFINIGLVPDAGTSFFLPRIVGLSRAMEMAMLGDVLSAEKAYEIGLVGKVVTDEKLAEETMAFANRLANAPTVALGRIKEMMTKSFERDLATALEIEAEGQSFCGKTRDHQEGIQAFFEKRKPRFKGE